MSATTTSNMVAREGSGSTKPKSNRKGSNNENPIQSENETRVVENLELPDKSQIQPRANNHGGSVPKLPVSDDKVKWPMMEIKFRSYLKRFPGYVDALHLEIPDDEEEIEALKLEHGVKLDTVYSLIVEMCGENETANLQVTNHANTDAHEWPNNLWKLLQERFTVESRNRLQIHLNTLGQFEMTDGENLKQMVDRFNKVMGECRSIDASQLPTDLNLMGILKNAVKKVPILYAFLEYHQSPT